jgi:HAD superfamily phosphoserine phosphatase-like hydrolase
MKNPGLVFLFDLDGTITDEEILPLLAREVGLFQEISELTARTIAGDIPFEESFKMRVDILKSIPISVCQSIVSKVKLNDNLMAFIAEFNHCSAVVTGNLDVWIKPLVDSIGIPFFCSKAKYDGNVLTGIESLFVKDTALEFFVGRDVVAVGDGNNDLPLFKKASFSIAYGGVHRPAQSLFDDCHAACYESGALCQLLRQL